MINIAIKYLKYYSRSLNGKGHGIHSPFVFDFVTNVLNDKRRYYSYVAVEHLRKNLLQRKEIIEVEDLGAGSVLSVSNKRTIGEICRNTSKSAKFGQLLFRCSQYFKPSNIVELGTSLGISTAYLSLGNLNARVITCEGSAAVANVARQNFEDLGFSNIEIRKGNFDQTLPVIIKEISRIDMAFIDGNHREEPTLRYFHWLLPSLHEGSVLIFDDIHWSEEMESAWNSIKEHPSVKATIDLFFIGIVFFRDDFKVKQHFEIRF